MSSTTGFWWWYMFIPLVVFFFCVWLRYCCLVAERRKIEREVERGVICRGNRNLQNALVFPSEEFVIPSSRMVNHPYPQPLRGLPNYAYSEDIRPGPYVIPEGTYRGKPYPNDVKNKNDQKTTCQLYQTNQIPGMLAPPTYEQAVREQPYIPEVPTQPEAVNSNASAATATEGHATTVTKGPATTVAVQVLPNMTEQGTRH